jgi:NAD(P)-dependent dehydrogenase (short-subunit alcohol dehydrogenase family)
MIGNDPLDLGGQAALVTGAGQGAGRAIALALAQHNAGGVAVNDFVLERAATVAAEIEAIGVRAVPVQADVGDHASVTAAFEKARAALGPITMLVNNAGNAGPGATMGHSPFFWESRPADWDRFFRTNLQGVMNCCHVALPEMVAQKRGRIVTIVSDSGRVGEARLAAYSAAKSGAATGRKRNSRTTPSGASASRAMSRAWPCFCAPTPPPGSQARLIR